MAGPNWTELGHDLLQMIAVRAPVAEDFIAFRGVCTSWRAAATKKKFKPSIPAVPLLMIAEKKGNGDGSREFYSLFRRNLCLKFPIPEAAQGRKCIDAGFGLCLSVSEESFEVILFNPFSGARIVLPTCIRVQRAALSANPSETSNFVLLVIANDSLSFWRPGNSYWTRITLIEKFHSFVYYNHKFYASSYGSIWAWDPFKSDPIPVEFIRNVWFRSDVKTYLVETSDGGLVFIYRSGRNLLGEDLFCENLEVFRLDVANRELERVRDLGDDAVFIGENGFGSCVAALIVCSCFCHLIFILV